jgi:hypothetical protein
MVLLLHGVAGGLDELLIAVAAVGVLWLAVKLAGRKPASEQEEDEQEAQTPEEEQAQPARPPAASGS